MRGNLRRTAVAVSPALGALAVALSVLSVLLAGCSVVSQPDAKDWDKQVQTTLEDTASEVGTARLALESAAHDRVWSPYSLVLLSEAEESAGKLESDLSALQPPPSRQQQAEDVLDLLESANSAVREARVAAVEEKYDDPDLVANLAKLHDDLEQASKAAEPR